MTVPTVSSSGNEAASIAPAETSQTELCYGNLRSELLAGAFPSGERLKTAHLASRFGVSLSVVREALTRLTNDGLTVASSRRGFCAAGISVAQIEQQADAMREIEAICLRRSIAAASQEWEDRVEACFTKLAATPVHDADAEASISSAFSENYAAFRDALVSACDNPVLLETRARLRALGMRHENICIQLGAQSSNAADDHRQLLEAALARDSGRAVRLLSTRIKANAKRFVAAYCRAYGG